MQGVARRSYRDENRSPPWLSPDRPKDEEDVLLFIKYTAENPLDKDMVDPSLLSTYQLHHNKSGQCDYEPTRLLVIAVIEQALLDFLGMSGGRWKRRLENRVNARRWLFNKNSTFQFYCESIGWDVTLVRRRLFRNRNLWNKGGDVGSGNKGIRYVRSMGYNKKLKKGK